MNSFPTWSRHLTLSHGCVYSVYFVYSRLPLRHLAHSTRNRHSFCAMLNTPAYSFQKIIIFAPKIPQKALFLHFLAKKFAKP